MVAENEVYTVNYQLSNLTCSKENKINFWSHFYGYLHLTFNV